VSIAIIINPISGGSRRLTGEERAHVAALTLERLGEVADVMVTERPGHARLLAKAAVRRGARLVIAWGGDGTVNEIACELAFSPTPLGIVPAGSGNGLARELGIDPRPDAAIVAAVRANPRPIDLGELGGRLFVNVAGIGIDAHVAAGFNAAKSQRRGFVSYIRIGLQALLAYRAVTYQIAADDFNLTSRAVLVAIANSGQYGNGARIAPSARIDDGELDLVVVSERSRLATCWQARRLFNGTVARVPGCSIRRTRQVRIESDAPMAFHVDGEPVQGGTELTARIHPGALRISVK
jgi:diacylglycerol kinase (ATP)